jgi:hypothetical protein
MLARQGIRIDDDPVVAGENARDLLFVPLR